MIADALGRPAGDLRISVTDRCNFRCSYCMPLGNYEWLDRREILSYEEITRLASLFLKLGVDKIRLTGGEPLLRRDLHRLVASLSRLPGLSDLCLTTNGERLVEMAAPLRAAGLKRINVSLDTLNPEKFRRLTQRGRLETVLEGLRVAKEAGLNPVKINAVIERGVNEEEIVPLVEFTRRQGFAIRFIEYMDAGNANQWRSDRMLPKEEILAVLGQHYRLREIGRGEGSAPAVDYQLEDGTGDIGVIASVTEPFCFSCNRARLTADGKLVTCLFSSRGHDLKAILRSGASEEEMLEAIRLAWQGRSDRYSEERLEALRSAAGYRPGDRQKIEMIRLGG